MSVGATPRQIKRAEKKQWPSPATGTRCKPKWCRISGTGWSRIAPVQQPSHFLKVEMMRRSSWRRTTNDQISRESTSQAHVCQIKKRHTSCRCGRSKALKRSHSLQGCSFPSMISSSSASPSALSLSFWPPPFEFHRLKRGSLAE